MNTLDIAKYSKFSEVPFDYLSTSDNVMLNMTQLTPENIVHILTNFPNIKRLALGGTLTHVHTHIDFTDIATAIGMHPQLTHLVFYGNKLGDEGAKLFASVLKTHPTLQYVDISSNNIYADGAMHLNSVGEYRSAYGLHPIVIENKFNYKKTKTEIDENAAQQRLRARELLKAHV